MKIKLKSPFFCLIALSLFCSCQSYKVMYYKSKDYGKVIKANPDYKVYIHDKKNSYQVDSAKLTPNGVKGILNPMTNPALIAEIKDPRTPKQLRKHKNDLNLYTKTEINTSPGAIALKKDDISEITNEEIKKAQNSAGDIVAMVFVTGLCVVLWIGIIDAFLGRL